MISICDVLPLYYVVVMIGVCVAVTLCSLLAVTQAGLYTVTDEVWFDVEVKDTPDGRAAYKGRFTVALFGETAPMTVMNFVAITKGYQRKGEVRKSTSIFMYI